MQKSPNIEKMAVSRAAARCYHHYCSDVNQRKERPVLKKRAHKRARRSFKQQLIDFLKGDVDVVAYVTNCQVGDRDVI